MRDDGHHVIDVLVESRDWPVIRRLEADGRLAYAADDTGELADKLRALGLDR